MFEPATGTWSSTGGLRTGRRNHSATLLANGKVLVAGGNGATGVTNGAEVYNPLTGTWTATGGLNTARDSHTATLLPNGRVMVAGGHNNGTYLTSVELFDAATGIWTTNNPLGAPRARHTATLLPNGTVLVAGGVNNNGTTNRAELFNPTSGTWTPTASMLIARESHTATLLPNGKVLVACGHNSFSTYLSAAELYDPATGQWTATSGTSPARRDHTATLLPDGRTVIVGGFNGMHISGAQAYDIGLGFSNSWQPQIITLTSPISPGAVVAMTGSKFRGISEGSGANTTQNSPSDHPVVQLRAIDSGQTAFLSATSWDATGFNSSPVPGLPSGYALATVFVNGIPGASRIVLVDVPLVVLIHPMKLAGGAFRFSFTNVPGASFTAITATNIAAPRNTWTVIGGVSEIAAGQYQFTDSVNTNDGQRFYSVRQP